MSVGDEVPDRKKTAYKLVMLGDGGVGKSALTIQFVANTFTKEHNPTIEEAYRQQCNVDGEIAHLDILDTAGQPEFTPMRDQYMKSGEGFLLCYSITDRRSFQEIEEYKQLIHRVRCRDRIPVVLVGNKCDLDSQRQVPAEEGRSFALKYRCPFFETSAANRHCVDEIYHEIIREIRNFEHSDSSEHKRKNGLRRCLVRIKNWHKSKAP